MWPFSRPGRASTQRIELSPQALLSALSYQAASNPRTQPRTPNLPAHAHLDAFTRYQLVTRSRELERNCDYYDAAIGNFVQLLVGTGPVPRPLGGDAEWRAMARDLFMRDAGRCLLDHRRRTAWGPWLCRLARSIVRDGEAWVWDAADGGGLLWEAERVKKIHLDEHGRNILYDLLDERGNAAGQLGPDKLEHCAWITRESQTNGHPVLASGLDDWAELNSLYEAETVSAANAARVWVLLQGAAGMPGAGAAFTSLQKGGSGGPAVAQQSVPSGWKYQENGAIMAVPPGLSGTPWSPDRPNVDVPVYVKERMRTLISPLGSYELIFMDISSLNYAGIRGLKRLAEMQFHPWRNTILRGVCDRRWVNWCRTNMVTGRLPYAAGWENIDWRWPDLPIQDREKDALADERELKNGTASLAGIIGDDEWQRVQDEREAVVLRQALLRLNTVRLLQEKIDEAGLPLDANLLLGPGGEFIPPAVETAA
jgi:hypothetical protein